MADQTFTQEQVNEAIAKAKLDWEKELLKPLQVELEDLKGKVPPEKTDAEKALEQAKKELFQKQISVELKDAGLSMYEGIINPTDEKSLNDTIKALNKVHTDLKIQNSYTPTDKKKGTDSYDVAKQNGDTKGMVKSIFGFNK
ncbi:hypothetical protein [Ornithinibacillus sp. 179-J 7C1 HS]|uniref:hypothetical protein n=1 Tax=Ornithinibacillus sp. 179-J 7C1 HS TaxID=3142384 RepID=UPI0039A071A9